MDASDIVAKLIYYALALFVLQLAFGVFGPNPISDLLTQIITFLPSLVVAIIILVVAAAIAAAVKGLIENTPRRPVLRQVPGQHRLDLHPVPRHRRRPQPGRRRHHGHHPGADRDPRHRGRRDHRRCRRWPHQADAAPLGGLPEQGRGRGSPHQASRPPRRPASASRPSRPAPGLQRQHHRRRTAGGSTAATGAHRPRPRTRTTGRPRAPTRHPVLTPPRLRAGTTTPCVRTTTQGRTT